uniref:ATP synthase complex subunit 8 n=1 Tax=Anomophysis sp. ASCT00116655 TaxID=2546572 RepID=A0A7G8JRX1_9CUCU|nr:ATP synthase F0 subunit 8 [Anomophysis sp. ASCT00116655]
MPQMAPMNWLILMIFSILVFITFNILNYFTLNYKAMYKKIDPLTTKVNWKW